MRFALLGNHPDGVAMASALVETGRHQLLVYTTGAIPEAVRGSGAVQLVSDLEEVLARPDIDAVIVAGTPANRPAQLRRSLQSERHVLCVYPPDEGSEIAYEAVMIQGDLKRGGVQPILFPLLKETLHPGIVRLREALAGSLGDLQFVELQRHSTGDALIRLADAQSPAVPDWHVLRALGGEIAEVSAFAGPEELPIDLPAFVAGRFAGGGVFQANYLPQQKESNWRISITANRGQADLYFPLGWPGPAFLNGRDAQDEWREETWELFDPWPAVVTQFESATQPASENATPVALTWQDAIRGLELDFATRRSVEKRRSVVPEYPEANEEVGYKGTMTLVGCGLLWLTLVLLFLSYWFPMIRWAIVVLLVLFLILLVLGYVVRREEKSP